LTAVVESILLSTRYPYKYNRNDMCRGVSGNSSLRFDMV